MMEVVAWSLLGAMVVLLVAVLLTEISVGKALVVEVAFSDGVVVWLHTGGVNVKVWRFAVQLGGEREEIGRVAYDRQGKPYGFDEQLEQVRRRAYQRRRVAENWKGA